ncbi:hypothetical protein KY285_026580 [Solanum tuberosum]|nr:hypothetical protein KY289_026734 [Solanum tuberosum]KAH0661604.1 hypothetical protein KY284_026535 [Solanum tuberosum]KAH0665374.1 hypothetical protein KY285_026580 [Solanum tuberosum]
MPKAMHNCNGKIWIFTNHGNIYATIVYAKCDASRRMELWDDIYSLANGMSSPWLIGGDFNVVLSGEEKI